MPLERKLSSPSEDSPARKPLVPGLKPPSAQKVAPESPQDDTAKKAKEAAKPAEKPAKTDGEAGGRGGLDPTRYGDWEINGRCVDF